MLAGPPPRGSSLSVRPSLGVCQGGRALLGAPSSAQGSGPGFVLSLWLPSLALGGTGGEASAQELLCFDTTLSKVMEAQE